MFDTVSIALPPHYGADLDRVLSRLECVEPRQLSTQVSMQTGKLGPIDLKAAPHGIFVRYSVPKLVHGSNVHCATRNDCERSFEAVGDALGLDLSEGRVTRLDLADTWAVAHPVPCYLDLFDTPHGFDRLRYTSARKGETLSLQRHLAKTRFEISLYDKRAEVAARKGTLPPPYVDCPYLLRPEVKFTKGLRAQLKKRGLDLPDLLTPAVISSPAFYPHLLDLWASALFSLPTLNKASLTMLPDIPLTPREVERLAAAARFKEKGTADMLALINQDPSLSKSRRSEFRKRVRELAALPVLTEPNELLDEFREHVRASVESYQ